MTTSTTISSLSCNIPSSLSSILLQYQESVFEKRPASLIPSLPLVIVQEEGKSTTVGEATIGLIATRTAEAQRKKSFGIVSVKFFTGHQQQQKEREAVHVSSSSVDHDDNDNKNNDFPSSKAIVAELFDTENRWVKPRNIFHLPLPSKAPIDRHLTVFVASHQSSNNSNELRGTSITSSFDDEVDKILSTSLQTWCSELEKAITAGKRFAPILRSKWSWRQEIKTGIKEQEEAVESNNSSDQILFVMKEEEDEEAEHKLSVSNETTSSSTMINKNILTIPLGTVCACSVAAKVSELRTDGLPFDWILTPSVARTMKLVNRILFDDDGDDAAVEHEKFDAEKCFAPAANSNSVIPLTHRNNTNRYFTAKEDETPTYVCNREYAMIASTTEAKRFGRRCERMKEIFWERLSSVMKKKEQEEDSVAEEKDEKGTVSASSSTSISFIYIGRPFQEAESFFVDDESIAPELLQHHYYESSSSSENNNMDTMNNLIDEEEEKVKRLIESLQEFATKLSNKVQHHPLKVFFFAFNEVSKSFIHFILGVGNDNKNDVEVVIIHQFVGYPSGGSTSWDSIGYVCGRKLPGTTLMKNVVVNV